MEWECRKSISLTHFMSEQISWLFLLGNLCLLSILSPAILIGAAPWHPLLTSRQW